MSSNEHIDRIARMLATQAGFVWDRLDHYPGYIRNRLRQQAREMLGELASPRLI